MTNEALTNVAKHANAQQVKIKLIWTAEILTLVFVDDGCGFDPDASLGSGNFGLAIMKERAEQINGFLSIKSSLNAGTKLTLQIPLQGISEATWRK